MAEFDFESLDISRVNNETIAELGEVLWQCTSVRNQEDISIAEKYGDSVDALYKLLRSALDNCFLHLYATYGISSVNF